MGKIVKYPESDITKEIEKDGFKVTIEVYKGDQGGWILERVKFDYPYLIYLFNNFVK